MSGMLVLSDLHAHAHTRFAQTNADGVNSRFADLLNVLDQVTILVDTINPSTLVIAGDLTHKRYFVQFSVYTKLCQWVADIVSRYHVDVIALVGNHDIEARGYHSLGPLALLHGVTVVDEPTWLDLLEFGWTYFVPYMEGDRVVEAIQHLTSQSGHRPLTRDPSGKVFLHYALDGKVMGGGEYAVPSALRLSDFDTQWNQIILGHVHAPSVESDGRVIYVGAPLHFDFGDSGDRYAWHFPSPAGAPRAYPLRFPKFVTTTYPKMPIAPLEFSGFLRVLNAPKSLLVELKQAAITDGGWRDAIVQTEPVAHEQTLQAIAALSRVSADESLVVDYVTRHYPDADVETRSAITTYILGKLREAQT